MPVFLFTDIEGSTRLWERHTKDMGAVIARHDAILRGRIEACGGRITKHTGDGVTAAFVDGEAVGCALEMQKQLAAESWDPIAELRIRVALHAGEAERRGEDYFGPAVNCTARIMAAAWGGQVLLTPTVTAVSDLPPGATLVDLGEHLLKDVTAPQRLFQLLHPDLLWREFPPLRTLSGSAIRHSIDEQGGRLASLPPASMALGLVSAALAPTLLGDLPPTSPTLAGNLGVLVDLGASSLGQFLADFVERLRAEKGAGKILAASEIRRRLEAELLEWWERGGEESAVLRSEASRLLQAIQMVEATLDAAPEGLQEALAQSMVSLGGSFQEFRWMTEGLQKALADVRVGQAVQLAMQKAQLDLQQQQLVKTDQLLELHEGEPLVAPEAMRAIVESEDAAALILSQVKQDGVEVLDLPTLSVLYAGRRELQIDTRAAGLILRSALHHGVDIEPWISRLGPQEDAVRMLRESLGKFAKPEARIMIVQGLGSLQGDEATAALIRVALSDDTPDVRARAAVMAAQRGRAVETAAGLISALGGPDHAAALAAFVAVADEVGIPEQVGPYPKMSVFLALAWRRWQANRAAISRQTIRATLSGTIMSVFGCLGPLFWYLLFPEDYYGGRDLMGLSAWILSGAMMFLFIGCLQGAASGFALGVADALWHNIAHRGWRLILGAGSGLALATLLILLSFWNVAHPEAGAGIFIPVYIAYGLAFGIAATFVIPELGAIIPLRRQLRQAAGAMLVTTLATVPYVFLLYPSIVRETLVHRLAFAVVFPLILALTFNRRPNRVSALQIPPVEDRGV